MHGARTRCATGVAGLLLAIGASGCSAGEGASPAASLHSGDGPAPTASHGISAAPVGATATGGLAPAGPAPGGPGEEGEGEGAQVPFAAALARDIDCADFEPQAHVAAVDEQLSCRRGVDRVYVMTFRSTTDRDTYLSGAKVVSGGFDVVGPTWVVHLADAPVAESVATRLGGSVRPAS